LTAHSRKNRNYYFFLKVEDILMSEFLIKTANLLALDLETIAQALIYLHTFIPFSASIDPNMRSLACLQLACKQREIPRYPHLHLTPRKLRDFLNSGAWCLSPPALIDVDADYFDMRDSLCTIELLLLRSLEFNVARSTAFTHIPKILTTLFPGADDFIKETRSEVERHCNVLILDCYMSGEIVERFDARELSLGCVAISCFGVGIGYDFNGPG
jgi:hypothetical protein